MSADHLADVRTDTTGQRGLLLATVLIVMLGAALRFERLGARSLWLDEFSTWHVSRMDLAESLRWGPERTVPPLYQFALRLLAEQPHPPEWVLRLPAAIAGSFAILAGWWLGRRLGGPTVGVALALLLACSQVQVDYSQEARPYSLLVLGSTLSVMLWHQLVTRPTRRLAAAHVIVTALTAYAHCLVALTVLGEVGWWLQRELRRPNRRRFAYGLVTLLATAALCLPLALWTLVGRSDVTAALGWIQPPTAARALAMLAEVGYGYGWLVMLLPAVLLSCAWRAGLSWPRGAPVQQAARMADASGLLLWWLGASWIGLILVSLLVMPLMVTRYVLPAAVPALLLPLLVAGRFHRYAALAVAALAVALSLPALQASRQAPLGFRELAAFLDRHVDPHTDTVVNAVAATQPSFVELESLAFRYYTLPDVPIQTWLVNRPLSGDGEAILSDPRRLYVVAFLADPLPAIRGAGRQIEPFVAGPQSYSQLVFGQYRLLKVAPLSSE